jgi:hypothetical protein
MSDALLASSRPGVEWHDFVFAFNSASTLVFFARSLRSVNAEFRTPHRVWINSRRASLTIRNQAISPACSLIMLRNASMRTARSISMSRASRRQMSMKFIGFMTSRRLGARFAGGLTILLSPNRCAVSYSINDSPTQSAKETVRGLKRSRINPTGPCRFLTMSKKTKSSDCFSSPIVEPAPAFTRMGMQDHLTSLINRIHQQKFEIRLLTLAGERTLSNRGKNTARELLNREQRIFSRKKGDEWIVKLEFNFGPEYAPEKDFYAAIADKRRDRNASGGVPTAALSLPLHSADKHSVCPNMRACITTIPNGQNSGYTNHAVRDELRGIHN